MKVRKLSGNYQYKRQNNIYFTILENENTEDFNKKINTGPYIATLREKRVMPQCEKQN
jgi:hypothetical protein